MLKNKNVINMLWVLTFTALAFMVGSCSVMAGAAVADNTNSNNSTNAQSVANSQSSGKTMNKQTI